MYMTADNKSFDALMLRAHYLDVRVELRNVSGGNSIDVSEHFIAGNVSVDTTADVTRALDLTLFDPDKRIHLDPGSPSKMSVFIDQEIQITYAIIDPVGGARYECPVFTGPIDDVDRDELFVAIKALGKEAPHTNNAWRAKEFKKGQKKTRVIKFILTNFIGESVMRVPNLGATLPTDVKLNRERSPIQVIRKIARSMNRLFIYDAAGIPTLRRRSKRSKFTFDESWVTLNAKKQYDLAQVTNTVLVMGKKPKKGKGEKGKKKNRPQYKAVAPRKHPLSPWSLGKSGAPRYLWTIIEDDNLKSVNECRKVAKDTLARGLLAGIDVQFEGIPQPRLQEGDVIKIDIPGFYAQVPIKRWTIPLNAGDDASYGYLRKSPPKGKMPKGKQASQFLGVTL